MTSLSVYNGDAERVKDRLMQKILTGPTEKEQLKSNVYKNLSSVALSLNILVTCHFSHTRTFIHLFLSGNVIFVHTSEHGQKTARVVSHYNVRISLYFKA